MKKLNDSTVLEILDILRRVQNTLDNYPESLSGEDEAFAVIRSQDLDVAMQLLVADYDPNAEWQPSDADSGIVRIFKEAALVRKARERAENRRQQKPAI